mmetsp:Transcript_35551/g.65857  ORF Transcript_35551/g.65857 Transcript_35551/m.65857 type:complete len:200 (-) Transcript_35551:66-665(-)
MPSYNRRISEIVKEKVYLTDMTAAIADETLVSCKMTHVVNASNRTAPNKFESRGVKYLNVDIEDELEADLSEHFEKTYQFAKKALDEEKGVVLFHCMVGKSRSPTLVIAFLLKHRGCTLKEAFAMVKEKRPLIAPNPDFAKQLVTWAAEVDPSKKPGITVAEMCGGAAKFKQKNAKGAKARSALDGLAGKETQLSCKMI